MEDLRIQRIPVKLLQNGNVVKISHAGVSRSPGDDGLQLLRQHGFQIIGPHINRPIFQHELKTVPYLFWGNGIAGGNINLQRSAHPVKECYHCDPDAGIFRLIHDLRDAFYLEGNAVINGNRDDLGHHVFHVLHVDIGSLDGRIQVHCRASVQAHHRRHQHTAFENEFVPICREGDTLQEPLHHVVSHQDLRVRSVFPGQVADQIFQLPCRFYHKSTSKYCRKIFSTRNSFA